MITGTVESQSKKEVKTKFGLKPTWSLKIDGEWYSCGFTDPRCTAGDVIAFSFTEGKYGKEIDKGTIMKTGSAPVPAPTYTAVLTTPAPKSVAPVSNRPFPIPALHGDRAIIRQNALAHASRIVASGLGSEKEEQTDEGMATRIIHLARQFEAYSCGDLDVAKAKEMVMSKAIEKELGV